MSKPQFEIRTLLVLTAVVACGLTYATQSGNWLVALLVTVLLANVLAVIVALVVYVGLPMFGSKPVVKNSSQKPHTPKQS